MNNNKEIHNDIVMGVFVPNNSINKDKNIDSLSLIQEIGILKSIVLNMQCCGNCKNTTKCFKTRNGENDLKAKAICKAWESDNVSQDDRKILYFSQVINSD